MISTEANRECKFMTKPLLILFTALVVQQGQAATLTATVKETEKVVVVLNDSNVNILPTNNRQLQIQSSDPSDNLILTNKDGIVEVRAAEKTGNKKAASKVDISLPAGIIELHAQEGSIILQKHKGDMLLHLQKGKILIKDNVGQANLHAQKGDIQVLSHQGKLIVDSYMAGITIKDLIGDLELQNFGGETHLEKDKGFLNLNIGQGAAKVLQSSGSLSFELGKGTMTAQLFQGRIDGQTQEGQVNISMASESDLNIKSQSGKVTVQTAANAGSYINVVSQEGDIYGPSYMKVNRDSGIKILRGRLKGDTQKGSIVVRTQEAAVIIK
jgi:DUF4097 and DUF4098 domain-containing protein YvlB